MVDLDRLATLADQLHVDKSNITLIMQAIWVVAKAQKEIQDDLAWIKKKLRDEI